MKKYLSILPFLLLASCNEEVSSKEAEENLNKTLPVGCYASYKGWHTFNSTRLPIVLIQCKDKNVISVISGFSVGKSTRQYATFIIED